MKAWCGAIVALALLAPLCAAVAAQRWHLLAPDSRLDFIYLLQGQEVAGHFTRFEADILFDPNDLAASHIAVDIDLASARAGDGERDAMLAEKDWFHVSAHPLARFQTTDFEALGGGRYRAHARLSIKGMTREVVLPFRLMIRDDIAHATGSLVLERTRFDIGSGGWAKGDVVGLPVRVIVDIKARRGAD
ncbi:MAG: polyisoprenoid-binding protein [Alphaproteobacteria bacterium]|nr:MAG: polyisoprenoid-binding protein [Alphaproteobacteria bacterium]